MSFFNAIKIWFCACRPKTLVASAMPVCVAFVMAAEKEGAKPLVFFITLFCAIVIQIATNLINDYFDYLKGADTENRYGPTRMVTAGLVSVRSIRIAIAICLIVALLLGGYLVLLGGYPIAIIGIISLICAFAYTAGPSPLAYNGWADLFVWIFFGPVAVGGTYYLLTGGVTFSSLLVGAALGSLITSILVVNNLRDVDGDRRVNKRTLTVRFGEKFSKAQYLILMSLGAIIPIVLLSFLEKRYGGLLSLLYLILALSLMKKVVTQKKEKLNRVLELTGATVFLFSLFFSIGWCLHI
ncbi:MAG: 1,4-dihydroxy-2-naphthoate polyprenyltransferase [Bdellovibrionota bacterium]